MLVLTRRVNEAVVIGHTQIVTILSIEKGRMSYSYNEKEGAHWADFGIVVKLKNDVFMSLLAIKGNQCRLGFAAPKSLKIHRLEVEERIKIEGERMA